MLRQEFDDRTRRCCHRSLRPIASSTDSDLKTVDPVEWARLKIEYERQCYQDAEKAARDRLALLQTSSTCEIEPVRQQSPVRRPSAQPR